MRTLSVNVLLMIAALAGCKNKTPENRVDDKAPKQGVSGKTMGVAAKPAKRQALPTGKLPLSRPAVSTKAPPVTGGKPVAGLERAAFIPADAIAYGSFDSQGLLTAAKPVIMLFFRMRARTSKSHPKAKVKVKVKVNGKPVTKIKRRSTPPKLTYPMLISLAKRKYGLDVNKLGRVTVIGVVPPPGPKGSSASYGEPVFLAPSAAYSPPPNTKPVETVGGVPVYAVTGRPTRSRIAVVGDTLIFGETAMVRRVLATRLGKAPRIGDKAPLVRSIRAMRAAEPKATSFAVLDFSALRKKITGTLGEWEKELDSGAIFITDKSLVVLVKGKSKRITLAATLIKVMLAQTRKTLPMTQKQLTKMAGVKAGKLFDEVMLALKTVVVSPKGDTLTIRLNASPAKAMTAVALLTYFMLAY